MKSLQRVSHVNIDSLGVATSEVIFKMPGATKTSFQQCRTGSPLPNSRRLFQRSLFYRCLSGCISRWIPPPSDCNYTARCGCRCRTPHLEVSELSCGLLLASVGCLMVLLSLMMADVQSGCRMPMGLEFEASLGARQSIHEQFLTGELLEEALSW